MIGRHHTRHVSHRGWLAPHISRPLTYFITAVTSPSFNQSAVLSARPSGSLMVHYVQRPQSCPLYLACLTPSLSTFLRSGRIASFWNLKLLMFGGQVSMMSKNRLTEKLDSMGSSISPGPRILHHLFNAHFVSHFGGNIPRLSSHKTTLALACGLFCIHHLF
jgi:hypothetical protein